MDLTSSVPVSGTGHVGIQTLTFSDPFSNHPAKRRRRFFITHIRPGTGRCPIFQKSELLGYRREARIGQCSPQASIPEERWPRILLRRRYPSRDLESFVGRAEICEQLRDGFPALVFTQRKEGLGRLSLGCRIT